MKKLKAKKPVRVGIFKEIEGYDTEFKATIDAVESEDLVAFANSNKGGHILVGVSEVRDNIEDAYKVSGVKTGDHEKLKILSKAQDCSPPIQLFVNFKEVEGKDIIDIDIPSGSNKPYCTKKGTYKVRGDGRNEAMTPDRA